MNITARIQGFPVDVNAHTLEVLVNVDARVLKVPFGDLVLEVCILVDARLLKVPFGDLILEVCILVDIHVLGLANVDTYDLEVAVLMTDKSNHLQPGRRTLVWIFWLLNPLLHVVMLKPPPVLLMHFLVLLLVINLLGTHHILMLILNTVRKTTSWLYRAQALVTINLLFSLLSCDTVLNQNLLLSMDYDTLQEIVQKVIHNWINSLGPDNICPSQHCHEKFG
jgi:hypothetical protein